MERASGLRMAWLLPALSVTLLSAQNHQLVTLTIPGGNAVVPASINSSGDIVGYYRIGAATYEGFIRMPNGVVTTVVYPGAQRTYLHAQNDAGISVGTHGTTTSSSFTYVGGSFTTLPPPPGAGTPGGPSGINAAGVIVGTYNDTQFRQRGYVYGGSGFTVIDYPGAQHTSLVDINDQGTILGNYWVFGSGRWRGFTYDGATFTPFDKPGAYWTYMLGLNNVGQMVGQEVDTSGSVRTAFVFDGSAYSDLLIPMATGWTSADDINDGGVICGSWQGTYQGTSGQFGFVATPKTCQPSLGGASPLGAMLSLCGAPLALGGSADLLLTLAPPSAATWLAVSPISNPTPFAGGTAYPNPPTVLAAFMTDASGNLSLPGVPGGGGPLMLYGQFVSADPSAPLGLSLSNAVRADILP